MPSNPWHEEDDTCSCEHCQEPFNLVPLDLAVWNWREKLSLVTIDDCVERLAQEASLYTVLFDVADIAKEEDEGVDDFNWTPRT